MTLSPIQEIETIFPVNRIKVNGISIWPWIRTYLGSALLFSEVEVKKSRSFEYLNLLSSFCYGYRPKKAECLVFSAASQRKIMGGVFSDRVDVLANTGLNFHIFEAPVPKHRPIKKLPHAKIASKMPLILKERVLAKMLNPDIEGHVLIGEIQKKYKLNFSFEHLCRRFVAQQKIMQSLIEHNPLKIFILITPYTNMGYVYEARLHGIPVVEMQHGVISRQHYAYNPVTEVNADLYPNYLLSWGNYVADVFEKSTYIHKENVIAVGNYYIDIAQKMFSPDEILSGQLRKYKRSIAFTAQNMYEPETLPLICKAAEENSDVAVVYVPRDKKSSDYVDYKLPDNILFADHLNFYSVVQHCNFHATISSSCALEAPAFGKQNMLFDFKDRSSVNFKSTLPVQYTGYFSDFSKLLTQAASCELIESNLIVEQHAFLVKPLFSENVEQFISHLLSK